MTNVGIKYLCVAFEIARSVKSSHKNIISYLQYAFNKQ